MTPNVKTGYKTVRLKRFLFFLLLDAVILICSIYMSMLLRFDFTVPDKFILPLNIWLPFLLVVNLTALYCYKIYSFNCKFFGLAESWMIMKIEFQVFGLAFAINLLMQSTGNSFALPKSVIIMSFFLNVFVLISMRSVSRLYGEILTGGEMYGRKVLVIGAGTSGARVTKGINADTGKKTIVGFIDDDLAKQGMVIHGVPVLGTSKDTAEICMDLRITEAIIAIPSISHTKIKAIYDTLKSCGVENIRIAPSIHRMKSEFVDVKDIRDINLEDLLSRKTVSIDSAKIKTTIAGNNIMVLGAAGSIGSEIVMQLCKFSPNKIVAFEIDETDLHNLGLLLKSVLQNSNIKIELFVGDVRNEYSVRQVLELHDIDMIFHAAAYKHVPMMEKFPYEAIETNVMGTYKLAQLAVEYKVKKFINISTDKAVNPTSVMGATKRIAELICASFNKVNSTDFVSVRFGNVLGSRGSVIPTFLDQIKAGGPVTVTDREMTRYFMTIPEAVLLVLQAAAMGEGGEIFVLDMGKSVKILSLAENLITLNNLVPYKDIDIVFTGLREGEKLYEELLTDEESTCATTHKRIFISNATKFYEPKEIGVMVGCLANVPKYDTQEIKKAIKRFVPEYSG